MMAEGKPGRLARNPVIGFISGLMMPSITSQSADATLQDGQILPVLGGLQVVFTPGHTPGHVSYFAPSSNILFAGDSLNAFNNTLGFADGPFTWNFERGKASVRAQAQLGAEVICCGHGTVIRGPDITYPF
jgi:glyoxylase-like metal-dependent hydrolase (beta-lactamase superfamily II)